MNPKSKSFWIVLVVLALSAFVMAQTSQLPSGTQITVRTDQAINATADSNTSGTYDATVSHDVMDANGNVAIPKGSRAQLGVTRTGTGNGQEVQLGLQSVTVNGERYMLASSTDTRSEKEGLGKNKRTGKYVGGGALAGTVIGAIAGGAKGAVLGAIAGGAAGAGAEVMTKGSAVKIPAETELKFQLQDNVQIVRDNSYPQRNTLPANDQPHN